MKKLLCTLLIIGILSLYWSVAFSDQMKQVNDDKVDTTILYSVKDQIVVTSDQVSEYCKNGWSQSKPIIIYNANGDTRTILVEELQDYQAVGWYIEPVIKIYNKDCIESIVKERELEYYLSQGWYATYEEAKKASVNQRELQLLARIIHAEAADNLIWDRRYVAVVVMNRVDSTTFPNSITEVAYQKGQYACINNKKFNSEIPQECLEIAEAVMLGERFGVPSNVVFQSQSRQGLGVWKKIGKTYYCYGKI